MFLPRADPDRWLGRILGGWAMAAGAVVLLIVAFLIRESVPALSTIGIGRFLHDPSWHPAGEASAGTFNLVPMLVGTLYLSLGALLLAVPAGVASAVFCHFYAPGRVAAVYRRSMELLAGVPSVVYGFWGLVTLVPLIRRLEPPGQSLLAGILILALMVLPTVALTAVAALAAVPRSYLQGAAALGLGRWATARRVALPAALPGILSGALLAAARAVGENMAVLMVCGNLVQVPSSLFDPVRALTANIALEMGYATAQHRSALFVSGLVLIVVIALLMALVERWGERADA
jgi:phosphate transport system permease protein